jgi:hypothetical protein
MADKTEKTSSQDQELDDLLDSESKKLNYIIFGKIQISQIFMQIFLAAMICHKLTIISSSSFVLPRCLGRF